MPPQGAAAMPADSNRMTHGRTIAVIIVSLVIHRLSFFLSLDDVYNMLPLSISGMLGGGAAASMCGLLPHATFVLTSTRVVFEDEFRPGALLIQGGRIVRVAEIHPDDLGTGTQAVSAAARAAVHSGAHVEDYGNAIISPGIVDVHVHLNEPGRVEWEGAMTGTRGAAAGGVTTVIDMPLNSVPTTTTATILKQKIAAVQGKATIDVGFWGGLVPANANDPAALKKMLKCGALGMKCFLPPSGINDFPHSSLEDVAAAMPVLREAGVPLLVHAEIVSELPPPKGNRRDYQTFLATRPKSFEEEAIRMLLEELQRVEDAAALVKSAPPPGWGLHIVHLGHAGMLPEIAAAKARGLPVTTEVNAHHLRWADEDVSEGATLYKCMPPLRDRANLEGLWEGLQNGTIDMLASDHSPASPDMKLIQMGDFLASWGGIAGLQYSLPAVVTGMLQRGIPLTRTAKWWAGAPAKLAGLDGRKGNLAAGFDADIVVWDPDKAADTTVAGLYHRHKTSPYIGTDLKGRVLATFVRGQQVFAASSYGGHLSQDPCGQLILGKQLH